MATQPPTATEEEVAEAEPSGPLKYKTWSLKVSVHCEGCKRKVKKILLGIEGVYTVDVDTKLHKATVTASVDPEVLIRKLEKSGKHAELWPEKADQKKSKRSKKKNKQNDHDNPESNDNNDDSAPAEPDKPEPNKGETTGPPSKVVEVVNLGKSGGNVQFKEVRVEPNNPPAGDNNPHAPENKPPEGATHNAGNAGGGGGKKKKRKGKGGGANGNSNGGEPPSNSNGDGNDGPPCTQPGPQGQGPPPGYRSPPRNYPVYDHPPPYYAPPPQAGMPVYTVSYNTAYPSSRYTASYYANPPNAYAYVHQGGSDSAEGGPSDTFEMFSDENPNACVVM